MIVKQDLKIYCQYDRKAKSNFTSSSTFFFIFYHAISSLHMVLDYELSTIDSELLIVEKYGKRCNVCDNKVDPSSVIICVFAVADAVLRDLLAQLLTDNDDSPSHRHAATKSKRDQHYSVFASAMLVTELCTEDK